MFSKVLLKVNLKVNFGVCGCDGAGGCFLWCVLCRFFEGFGGVVGIGIHGGAALFVVCSVMGAARPGVQLSGIVEGARCYCVNFWYNLFAGRKGWPLL